MANTEEMVKTSIYIKANLRDRLAYAVDQAGISLVLSLLAEKWLNNEIEISVKPRQKDNHNEQR